MKREDIEKMRLALLQQTSQLEQMDAALKEASKPVKLDQATVGRLSRMDAMQGQQMDMETSPPNEHQLLKIAAALRRIDSGEYGQCFVCHEEIDLRRLQADPTSTRCMQCV